MSPSPAPHHRTYCSRFYVCGVFSLCALHQNLGWLAFSPIPDEAKSSYGLSDTELALLPIYSPACVILLTVPFLWLVQKLGLRIIFIASVWLLAIGFTIRVFVPYVPHAHNWTWLIHLGHIMIGLVGLPVQALPTRISSVWFPPHQRTFATAVIVNAEAVGVTLAFILLPLLVQQYGMKTMMYVLAEVAVFVAILATIYFPSRPPSPPSTTAGEERLQLVKSVKILRRNIPFILLIISQGTLLGGNFGFSAVLGLVFTPSGFNEKIVVHSAAEFVRSVAWMGAIATGAAAIITQLVGLTADIFQRRFKLIILLLSFTASALCIWFSLSLYGWGSGHPVNLFVTYVLINVCQLSTLPIFYEAAAEITYPITEGVSGGMLSITNSAGSVLFGIVSLSNVFTDSHPERAKAMAWVLTALSIIATVLMVFYREDYKRLSRDDDSGGVRGDSSDEGVMTQSDTTESSKLLIQRDLVRNQT